MSSAPFVFLFTFSLRFASCRGLIMLFSVVNNSLLITGRLCASCIRGNLDWTRVRRVSTCERGFEATRKCVRRNEAIVIEDAVWEIVECASFCFRDSRLREVASGICEKSPQSRALVLDINDLHRCVRS